MAELRRCIGSAKFGIEAHDAPVDDFPIQASQKDGLGRMCRTHWNQYTTALRNAALARKTATEETTDTDVTATGHDRPAAKAKRSARQRQHAGPAAEVALDAPTD